MSSIKAESEALSPGQHRVKRRAPDLARALRFSRRRHSWMTGKQKTRIRDRSARDRELEIEYVDLNCVTTFRG